MIQKAIPFPFVVAANGRSGSHFLMSLLNSTKKVGYIAEYLTKIPQDDNLPPDSMILSYFKECYEKAIKIPNPSGLWGTKVDINQLFIFKRFLEIHNLQPNHLKWIWLYRKNKFLQAISLRKASLTGVWGLTKGDLNKEGGKESRDVARSEVDISISDLKSWVSYYLMQDLLWDCFFCENQIIPHKIYYEDFVEETTWESTIAGIFDFLDVDYDLPIGVSTNCVKLATDKRHKTYETIIENMIGKHNIPVDGRLL